MVGFYDNSVCWKCKKKYNHNTDFICDYCSDTVCKKHVIDDGGRYFCSKSCNDEHDEAMK